jgi:hypothetical protein
MSSEQKIGRRRTISVIQADGTVATTVLETVGVAKPAVPVVPASGGRQSPDEPRNVPDAVDPE